MVETSSTKLAEMALRITAVHRWCVTGTPFTRGVEGNFVFAVSLINLNEYEYTDTINE